MSKNNKILLLTIFLLLALGVMLFFYLIPQKRNFFHKSFQKTPEPNAQEEPNIQKKDQTNKNFNTMSRIDLPQPQKNSSISVEEAIANRRSVRNYSDEPLSLSSVSQLVWAAQGVTGPDGRKRAAPSAGALYPLEVYVVAEDLPDLDAGVYHYLPSSHNLELVSEGRAMKDLARAALGQMFISEAPAAIVITGDYSVTTQKYGERGKQYVHMEAGHAAENLFLQATSLDLETVTVGAFQEKELKELLNIPDQEIPFYIMPI